MTRGVILLVAFAVWTNASLAGRQLPVDERRTFVDFATAPPASLDELLASATVVVEATIARSYPYDAPVRRGFGPQTSTAFALESVTLLKPDVWPTDTPVALMLRTNERDAGARLLRTVILSEPTLRVGERWILFLKPFERGMGGDPLVLASHDRESAFLVWGDAIVPAGHSGLSKRLGAMTRVELVAAIRGK